MTFILLDYEPKDSTHWHHHFIFKTRHYPTITAAHTHTQHAFHGTYKYYRTYHTCVHYTPAIPHIPTLDTTYYRLHTHTHHIYCTCVHTHPFLLPHNCLSGRTNFFFMALFSQFSLLSTHHPSLASPAAVIPPLNPRLTLAPALSCPSVFTTVSTV